MGVPAAVERLRLPLLALELHWDGRFTIGVGLGGGPSWWLSLWVPKNAVSPGSFHLWRMKYHVVSRQPSKTARCFLLSYIFRNKISGLQSRSGPSPCFFFIGSQLDHWHLTRRWRQFLRWIGCASSSSQVAVWFIESVLKQGIIIRHHLAQHTNTKMSGW